MGRSTRLLGGLFVGFILAAVAFIILVSLLAGDDLLDFGRRTVLRFRLSSQETALNTPIGTDATPVRFTVQPGDSARAIAQRLFEQGLINDADLFADYVQYEELDVELEAGTYFLNTTMPIKVIAVTLTDSSLSQITFTVLPGQRLEEIAANIDGNPYFTFSGADFMVAVGRGTLIPVEFSTRMDIPNGASLEGFMLPDTYSLPPEVDAVMLRDTLLDAFNTAIPEPLRQRALQQGYTMFEIVTLASIVERETVHLDEMPMVAGVYRNRLENDDWLLMEADPTVQYPLGEAGNWWPQITRANYRDVISDYNTYLSPGLPPGPIASPSIYAIEASINAEPSEFYYFRADCRTDGYHSFARTFEEHLANGC